MQFFSLTQERERGVLLFFFSSQIIEWETEQRGGRI